MDLPNHDARITRCDERVENAAVGGASRGSMRSRAAWFAALVGFVGFVGVMAWSGAAHAQGHRILPGHEDALLALLAPFELGEEVSGGYRVWGVAVERTQVRLTLRAPDGTESFATLEHHDDAPSGSPRTRSFSLTRASPDAEADGAWAKVLEAIDRNDRVDFWDAPTSVTARRWSTAQWFMLDGVVFLGMLALLALALALRLLKDEPKWIGPALLAIVVAGAAIRYVESLPMVLGAWPWTRLYAHIAAVSDGAVMAELTSLRGAPFFLLDVAFWTSFAYAALMPLVLFAHATMLLRDARAGVFAAFAIALLPQHIRYSRCEDGFIASLVLTSLAFALIHGWLRDRSRLARLAYIVALPLVLYPGYLLRPLNILFIVVYAAALLFLHTETAPRARRIVGLAVIASVGAVAFQAFLQANQETASGVARDPIDLVRSAFRVVLDPRLLVIDDPTRTPVGLIVLAVVGAVTLYRQRAFRMLAFLVGWLALFIVAHAAVVAPTMQPRYHLHLVVPFLLVAACGVGTVLDAWRAGRMRLPIAIGAASVLFAPLVHRSFVRDTDYVELHEYTTVRAAREIIPDGCTVVEVVGGTVAGEVRFARMGALATPSRASRYRVVPFDLEDRSGASLAAVEALVADPPACVHLYEGIACSLFVQSDETYAHACTALRRRLDATVVLTGSGPNRFYDASNAAGRAARVARIPFRLSRSHLRRPAHP